MTDATSSILGHYGAEDLVNRIMRALAAAGYKTASPTVEMLNLIDQLHGGGLNSTKAQAEMAGVAKDMRILDAGCGVGGSSRYLAHSYDCLVRSKPSTSRRSMSKRRCASMNFAASTKRLLSDKEASRIYPMRISPLILCGAKTSP